MHDEYLDNSWKNIKKIACMGVALNHLTQYEKGGNDLHRRIIMSNKNGIHFYKLKKKSGSIFWEKNEKEALSKFKNGRSARQVITAFWDCCGLMYAEFGPEAHNLLVDQITPRG